MTAILFIQLDKGHITKRIVFKFNILIDVVGLNVSDVLTLIY